jgi:hypothetical protein
MKPLQHFGMNDATCPTCGQAARPKMEHVISSDSPLSGKPLASLAIPSYDIVRVSDSEREYVYLLAADRDAIMRLD